jgi:hypothetical protein
VFGLTGKAWGTGTWGLGDQWTYKNYRAKRDVYVQEYGPRTGIDLEEVSSLRASAYIMAEEWQPLWSLH